MSKAFAVILLLALGACSSAPRVQYSASPCAVHEASYACQVERYHNLP
jgi:uncharacterized lipoprotein YmbA